MSIGHERYEGSSLRRLAMAYDLRAPEGVVLSGSIRRLGL